MAQYVTGAAIRALREACGLTQKQLAEQIAVSDKTISKWETGRGLPDISLLEPLAGALHVSVAELLSGNYIQNKNRAGNLRRAKFYVCPVCGNVIFSMGEGAFSCCGVSLPPLLPEPAEPAHSLHTESMDGGCYVSLDHPMTKEHYLTFAALVRYDRVQLIKLYPEQQPEAFFPSSRKGTLYVCCNRHGLFEQKL